MICLEDSKIIDLFFERSEQAVHELNCKYGAAIKKTTSNILHDRLDVEECVNDTFLQVWNSIPPRTPNPLSGYVCRIARNLAINRYHANNAVKRGGRYDLLLGHFGRENPAVGVGLYIDQLTSSLIRQGIPYGR